MLYLVGGMASSSSSHSSPSKNVSNTKRSNYITGTKKAFLRGLERRKLSREVRVLIEKMSLNVSIVAGILSSPNGAGRFEMLHVNRRLRDTGAYLELLLPQWSTYVAFPEPTGTAAKEKWWQERERVNRDFEALIRDYELVQSEANKLDEQYKDELNHNNNNNNDNDNSNTNEHNNANRRRSSSRFKELKAMSAAAATAKKQ